MPTPLSPKHPNHTGRVGSACGRTAQAATRAHPSHPSYSVRVARRIRVALARLDGENGGAGRRQSVSNPQHPALHRGCPALAGPAGRSSTNLKGVSAKGLQKFSSWHK